MSTENLVSSRKLQKDIKTMRLFGFMMKREIREKVKALEKQLDEILIQTEEFNDRFSSYGWCAYDSMSPNLMKRANDAFEEYGIDGAERVLVDYYKSDVKDRIQWIRNSSDVFMKRAELIGLFFEDHFAERYHASVPLALIIIDGAVNDFTKSKGFFAEGTSVDAWDCLVGCDNGLTKLKDIFNQNRTKTNTEPIYLPYRNGILHGRDLNYANEYVSCKCVALMFAVSDWMKMKNSEEKRKVKFQKESNPPPIRESIKKLQENREIRQEISEWKKRTVVVGTDIPASGTIEDYSMYPYVIPAIEMLNAWKSKNYGKLSIYLQRMFPGNMSEKKRAGECRKLFENKLLDKFEIIEIEERACALSKIVIRVDWSNAETEKNAQLTFGCAYETKFESVGVPWRNNGEWVLIPWDIAGLYK